MYIYYQPNPCGRAVGDCSVRAISAALDISWEEAFDILTKFARRDSMSHYSSRDGGYSNGGDFRMDMQNLMQNAPNDYVRQKIAEAMNGM